MTSRALAIVRSPGLAAWTLVLVAVAAVAGPALTGIDGSMQDLPRNLEGPSLAHPLGLDRLGRDQLVRILAGARVSLAVGACSLVISLIFGTAYGAVAGYRGGRLDTVLMRVVDVFLAFPGLLLAIALAAALGPGLASVVVALSVSGWTPYARVVRAEVLALHRREHVVAARALGLAPARVLCVHMLPSLAGPLAVQATFGFAAAIVAESSLSFLGLGVQPPTPSWGSMLADARSFVLVAPHLVVFPGLAITTTVLALNLLGDRLRDRLDVGRPSLVVNAGSAGSRNSTVAR